MNAAVRDMSRYLKGGGADTVHIVRWLHEYGPHLRRQDLTKVIGDWHSNVERDARNTEHNAAIRRVREGQR